MSFRVARVSRWAMAAAAATLLSGPARAQSAPADSSRLIRSIQLRRYDIFAPAETKGFVARAANALHFMTRPRVIERELLFHPGEAFDSAAVTETARNLRSLNVFRAVSIDSLHTDSGLVLRVTTADGWSTRPIAYLKTSGRTVVPTIGVEELNFLGSATLVSVRWRKDPDRSTLATSFRQPRLFAGRVGLSGFYSHLSDGDLASLSLNKPWFSLSGKSAWSAYAETRRETVLRFFEGEASPRITLTRRYQLGSAAVATALRAGPEGYVRVGLTGQLRRDDYADKARPDTLGRSITGSFGPFVQWRKARYLVSKGLEGFAREQDVDVSTAVGFGLNLTPRGFGYDRDGVGVFLSAITGFGQPRAFVQFQATAGGRYTSAGLDSGSVYLSSTSFLQPGRRHLAVLHASVGLQANPLPVATFDFGLGVGPRGFSQHAFTGDRAFFTTAEYRFTASENFLNLTAVGLAAFADYGGAWYNHDGHRTGWSVGTGLRFGFTRSTDTQSNRIDLAYFGRDAFSKGHLRWVIEKGFAFSSTGLLR